MTNETTENSVVISLSFFCILENVKSYRGYLFSAPIVTRSFVLRFFLFFFCCCSFSSLLFAEKYKIVSLSIVCTIVAKEIEIFRFVSRARDL